MEKCRHFLNSGRAEKTSDIRGDVKPDFDNYVGNLLNSIMAECARYFERLPIINDVEILRNIIYSGVWTRFDAAKLRHEKKNN